MLTEREAYNRLIRLANDEGRKGRKLYSYAIIPPRTAADEYTIMIETRAMTSATESWES